MPDGRVLSVEACTPAVFRVRTSSDGSFAPSLMERYGVVRGAWDPVKVTETRRAGSVELRTDSLRLRIDGRTGSLTLFSPTGETMVGGIRVTGEKRSDSPLLASLEAEFGGGAGPSPVIGDEGAAPGRDVGAAAGRASTASVIAFDLKPGERLYGLGSASRRWIQHRGHALRIWARYQRSESPAPFIMSTGGWGVFHNTTLRHDFDVGRFDPDRMFIATPSENADFFLLGGGSLPAVLKNYVGVTGGPFVLPRYAYGLCFGGNTMEDQFDVMDDALRFRQEGIPLDLYWIEPQWMASWYDFSAGKNWDYRKFPGEPYWLEKSFPKSEHHSLFIGRLRDWGVRTALWLCVDEDLSAAEEGALAGGPGGAPPGREDWSAHLAKFLDQGVAGFKIDPARTMDEHPDRKYQNGLTDAEMHQMNQVLILKQVHRTCRARNGRRPFLHYCGGYAGAQHWGAATSGDNGGGVAALMDQLNLGMSGFVNTSCDMMSGENDSPEGIHFGFFLPWVQVNSWFELLHPWYLKDANREVFRAYDRLRHGLLPYIYSTALEGALTGMPIVRAMPLAYPDDPNVSDNARQFMFGASFLTAAFSKRIYLPAGNWIDFWTGAKAAGGREIEAEVPGSRGGPLFVRAGAIVPCQRLDRSGAGLPADTLVLKIYPEGRTSFTLYEDDGESFGYEEGKLARTDLSCDASGGRVSLTIPKRRGRYDGMPERRHYEVELYRSGPVELTVNGRPIAEEDLKPGPGFVSFTVRAE
jgi:alpha-glucosidase (family GH31 glycosyl hydrolase)